MWSLRLPGTILCLSFTLNFINIFIYITRIYRNGLKGLYCLEKKTFFFFLKNGHYFSSANVMTLLSGSENLKKKIVIFTKFAEIVVRVDIILWLRVYFINRYRNIH